MSDSPVLPRAPQQADTRAAIIEAAARLLRNQGPAAVTTRAVAQAAGIQAPTIYRLFGDKDGLLEAVAEHVMSTFVTAKAAVVEAATEADVDPLADLRSGWESQIAFGLANPTLFRLLSDPARVVESPSAQSGRRVLEARVHRIAVAGRLAVSEERATGLIQAAGVGAITVLLSTPVDERDPGLADAALEAVLARILTDTSSPAAAGPLSTAVALRALTSELDALTDAERRLLEQWLDRSIDALQRG